MVREKVQEKQDIEFRFMHRRDIKCMVRLRRLTVWTSNRLFVGCIVELKKDVSKL